MHSSGFRNTARLELGPVPSPRVLLRVVACLTCRTDFVPDVLFFFSFLTLHTYQVTLDTFIYCGQDDYAFCTIVAMDVESAFIISMQTSVEVN